MVKVYTLVVKKLKKKVNGKMEKELDGLKEEGSRYRMNLIEFHYFCFY